MMVSMEGRKLKSTPLYLLAQGLKKEENRESYEKILTSFLEKLEGIDVEKLENQTAVYYSLIAIRDALESPNDDALKNRVDKLLDRFLEKPFIYNID